MRTHKRIGAVVLLLMCSQMGGCLVAAGLIAAGAYASSISDEDREKFHKMNLEREKAGLKPLTEDEWLMKNDPKIVAERETVPEAP